ncbi:MAG: CHAT domain-containing protein [Oscillatoriaceae cyanobacterium Prado104]|jgi:CHAT domain-containing protein|nr:CHAT domain-containing protein [Oscillatoriaceae cyanobacterium Prado104]
MNQERQEAYLNLIQQLLSCRSWEEIEMILTSNQNLLDAGFLQTLEALAQMYLQDGDKNTANWLINLGNQLLEMFNLSSQVAREQNLESLSKSDFQAYLEFLFELLQATAESRGRVDVVYSFLVANTDKIDLIFAEILRRWARAKLAEVEADTAQSIVAVIVEFSNLIQQFPLGNKASNMEIAIAGYEIAMNVYTREDFPVDWAMTQINLGTAYSKRIQGEKAENIEQAIAACDRALTVLTSEDFPVEWAMTQHNLGNAYNNRIIGEKDSNQELAIAAYNQAITVLNRENFPIDWAMIQINLGAAYRNRILGEKAENIEQTIAAYDRAIAVYTREHFPVEWAKAQSELAAAYIDRIIPKESENIEQAIDAYNLALTVLTHDELPIEWAMTQINLGVAYRKRIQGEKAENIEQAIVAYNRALTILTHEAFPVDWARTQNNLGNAYLERIQGDKSENMEQAISAYNLALTVRNREDFPVNWAATQNNLGNVYINRILGKKEENVEQAIVAYNRALTVYTHKSCFVEWAKTQINLGAAYLERVLGEKSENIEQAIVACTQALTVLTCKDFPVDWATTQITLGVAYLHRILEDTAENIEQAIAACERVLTIYTHEDFPVDWARVQNNLGEAYRNRILGEKSQNLEYAIAAYARALTVRTREAFPQDNAITLVNLGLLYYNEKQFYSAYDTFLQAIETVEYLRGEIVSGGESKRKQAEKWIILYRFMIETCLELGFNDQAIEYSDRSKTRNLVELLATRHLYPKGKIPENQRQKLQQLRREIDVEKRRLATDSQPDYTHINQLRQQSNEIYPLEPIRFQEIQALLDQNTAIIQWYIFDDYFQAFIITYNNSIIWKSSPLALENLDNCGDEYLKTYIAIKQAEPESAEQQELQNQWQNSLFSSLQNLAYILQINDILAQLPGTINQLIFIPHRGLHIFPLHSLPVNPEIWQHFNPESTPTSSHPYLLDCFKNGVRYAPSCQILQQLQQQQRPQFQRFFAIQTPTEDLYEQDLGAVAAIKKQFPDSPCILKQSQAQKSAILRVDETTNTATIHENLLASHSLFFFCHGQFKFDSPLDSGLQLADETLTLAEIIEHFDLKNTRLVTLSACETGLIDFDNTSDEYIGLPNGFLLAGSTNVVSSLWAVSRVATAFLMVKFYQELQQKTNIALALNTAQGWLRDTTVQGFQTWLGNSPLDRVWQRELRKYFDLIQAKQGASTKPFEQPYYWAAFCTIGKGE